MLWKSITEPTTIILTGFGAHYSSKDLQENVYMITDDEISFILQIGDDLQVDEFSDGYIAILPIDKFCADKSYQKYFDDYYIHDRSMDDDIYYDDECKIYILQNFIGEIYINKKYNPDGNLIDDSDDRLYSIIVSLPKNTEITNDFRKCSKIMESFQMNKLKK